MIIQAPLNLQNFKNSVSLNPYSPEGVDVVREIAPEKIYKPIELNSNFYMFSIILLCAVPHSPWSANSGAEILLLPVPQIKTFAAWIFLHN